jgi:hypothetical protein
MPAIPEPWAPPFPISFLTMILFGLSIMLDHGENDITIEEVKHHAKSGDLLDFLKERAGGVFASGFLEMSGMEEFKKWYVANIHDNCVAMDGRERRKYGIKERGLCLLVSYTAEIIQQGKDITLP